VALADEVDNEDFEEDEEEQAEPVALEDVALAILVCVSSRVKRQERAGRDEYGVQLSRKRPAEMPGKRLRYPGVGGGNTGDGRDQRGGIEAIHTFHKYDEILAMTS
jgi:hypothetical protein